MLCTWEPLLNLIPNWMREFVDKHGKENLQEIRLRIHKPPMLILMDKTVSMKRTITQSDLNFCINLITEYSPWSNPSGVSGYYTVPGGHRFGICGTVTSRGGEPSVIQNITSICIRISRDFPGIAKRLDSLSGSVLIIGAPGHGKTTFLRDYVRQLSLNNCVSVIDERKEIFPQFNGAFCFDTGQNTDVIFGCSKEYGINMALRNLGPQIIVVDEITAKKDCDALLYAGWCGVNLVATAHASSKADLLNRSVYRPIVESDLFEHLIVMKPDKSWQLERI